MILKKRIDEHISHCESHDEFGIVRGIYLSKEDWDEFIKDRLVRVKDARYYHGIAVHEVKGDRSYIVIEL